MTTEEMILVMQNWLAQGKPQLQFRYSNDIAGWTDLAGEPAAWDRQYDYRIEPREFWIELNTESGFGAIAHRKPPIGPNVVHVREVI